ncbi:MAG: CRTAC1 family protein [Deinococcota bacterium]
MGSLTFAQADSTISFQDVSLASGVRAPHRAVWDPAGTGEGYLAVGQAWGDYDSDGRLDLYVTGNLAVNVLYHNEGDGQFSVSSLSRNLSLPQAKSGGAIWVDYNNDGWRDLYVLTDGPNVLFRNNAGQSFSDVTEAAGVGDTGKGSSATWGDYDGDGFLDLYVVNWSCLPACQPEDVALSRDTLYRNLGDGIFADVTYLLEADKTLGAGFAASFVDVDSDGDQDLFVVNDKMTNPIGNVLWRNDGPGCDGWCWRDMSTEAGLDSKIHAMGLAIGDYDNNSQQDVFVTNMMSPMILARNLGQGRFENTSESAGVIILDRHRDAVGWGTEFIDFDNDGLLDLYVATSAMQPRAPGLYSGQQPDMEDMHYPYPDLVYRNLGDRTFQQVEEAVGQAEYATMGFAYADYDNDGRVDFVQGNWNDTYALYRNESPISNNWLTVNLVGGGEVNRDAAGTRVYLTSSDGVTQMREVVLGSSLGSGHDPRLHFGLGEATVSELRVIWTNGLEQRFYDVTHNQIFKLIYTVGEEDTND